MSEQWNVGQPGGPNGPFYSVVSSTGRVIVLQVLNAEDARLIAAAPQLFAACQKLIEATDTGDILSAGYAETLARKAIHKAIHGRDSLRPDKRGVR